MLRPLGRRRAGATKPSDARAPRRLVPSRQRPDASPSATQANNAREGATLSLFGHGGRLPNAGGRSEVLLREAAKSRKPCLSRPRMPRCAASRHPACRRIERGGGLSASCWVTGSRDACAECLAGPPCPCAVLGTPRRRRESRPGTCTVARNVPLRLVGIGWPCGALSFICQGSSGWNPKGPHANAPGPKFGRSLAREGNAPNCRPSAPTPSGELPPRRQLHATPQKHQAMAPLAKLFIGLWKWDCAARGAPLVPRRSCSRQPGHCLAADAGGSAPRAITEQTFGAGSAAWRQRGRSARMHDAAAIEVRNRGRRLSLSGLGARAETGTSLRSTLRP